MKAMRERIRNGVLFVMAIIGTVLMVVLGKTLADPVRTSVDIRAFRAENYLFESHDRLGFKPKPGIQVTDYAGSKGFDVLTDSRGARITPGQSPSLQTVNILGVGCSQTWGHGVQSHETFLARVGVELGLTVANLAVSGFGGTGALLQMKEHMSLDPNFVIYGLWEDHLNRNVNRCLEDSSPICVERPYLEIQGKDQFMLGMPGSNSGNLDRLRRFYLETSEHTDRFRTFESDVRWVAFDLWKRLRIVTEKIGAEPVSLSQKIHAMAYILEEMNRVVSSNGGKFVVVWIPLYFSSDIHPPPEELKALSKRVGFLMVDMSQRFHGMISEGEAISLPSDGHMNSAAHQSIAMAIARELDGPTHELASAQRPVRQSVLAFSEKAK